ncbi:hypothetical protein RPB_0074 [Rhodopseudomonas palustris HaA2]|uniref:Uncharacterized protein n=1 Tax=Rhodopseudomonas palustris (strain HaA2) TaxID=316058 RepID=Q2J424_RHOP2|nr:hypothetical protein [Rhodopseudomonas palustris]ABD04786.1 hypothetical protein RPB_0074 [Rhodopseudomonas palustris HaA2]
MATEISDFICVRYHVKKFGIAAPEGFAVLPSNFTIAQSRSDFLIPSEGATVRALFRNEGLPLSEEFFEGARYIQNNSYEWLAPTIFVSAGLLSENPSAVSLALGVLTNFISDLFKGISGKKSVKLSIVIEDSADYACKKIDYEGDLEGLEALAPLIKKVADGRQRNGPN